VYIKDNSSCHFLWNYGKFTEKLFEYKLPRIIKHLIPDFFLHLMELGKRLLKIRGIDPWWGFDLNLKRIHYYGSS